jgi:hypothetical protein
MAPLKPAPVCIRIQSQGEDLMTMTDVLCHHKPAAPKSALLLVSGLMWSLVGLMLCQLAFRWYLIASLEDHFGFLLAGAFLALAIHQFGFSIIARRNIFRIQELQEKPCIFAFMAWWNYPLVLFMIGLGLTLRHSPIPKIYLGVLYIGIGGALFLSSVRYYSSLLQQS